MSNCQTDMPGKNKTKQKQKQKQQWNLSGQSTYVGQHGVCNTTSFSPRSCNNVHTYIHAYVSDIHVHVHVCPAVPLVKEEIKN